MNRNNQNKSLTVQEIGNMNPITGEINPYPSNDNRVFGGGTYGSPQHKN